MKRKKRNAESDSHIFLLVFDKVFVQIKREGNFTDAFILQWSPAADNTRISLQMQFP